MTAAITTAAILAGGLGTRLRAAFTGGPKVLAPVDGRPFITYLLDQLEAAGIARVVICTGYRGDDVRSSLGDRHGRLALVYSMEARPLGTGGALRNALPLFEADPILVLNGDSWCDCHLPTFLAFHRARHAEGSIWLAPAGATTRFGNVAVSSSGEVIAFHEKTQSASTWINAGVYLLSRPMLESIGPDVAVSLEREVFPRWTGRGLFACAKGRTLLDIGTPESYAAASAVAGLSHRPRALKLGQRRAVLLDRDGTICVERDHLTDPDQVELLPGAAAGLRKLRALGLDLVLLTNQSAVGRGALALDRLHQIHGRLSDLLKDHGASLDAIYFCPHRADEQCKCRKPAPGMALAAARDLGFEPRTSFVVGDNLCDLELGRNAGAVGILVTTGYGKGILAQYRGVADYAVDNLADAADVIEYLLALEESATTATGEELLL